MAVGAARGDTATAIYREYWGDLFFTFTYENARFIVLNSDQVGEDRSIVGQQLQWLNKLLAENKQSHTFVFMHRPPDQLTNARAMLAVSDWSAGSSVASSSRSPTTVASSGR